LDIQKDVFSVQYQSQSATTKFRSNKSAELIETDNSIITLRESIKNTTKNQLENGTATTNDYLTAVNAQDQAQQNLLLASNSTFNGTIQLPNNFRQLIQNLKSNNNDKY
jgi:hypothetical protein